jgi:hypothetical protein
MTAAPIYRPGPLRRALGRSAALLGLRYYSVRYCERDLRKPIPEVVTGIPAVIRVGSEDDVAQIAARRDGEERKIIETIARWSTCFVAVCRDEIAGYAWVRTRSMHLFTRSPLGLHEVAALPADVVYTHNSYVFPKFRGSKLFQALLRAQYLYHRERSARYACNLIETVNLDSLQAHRRLGNRTQPARLLKLPGGPVRFVGPSFKPEWSRWPS